MWGIVSRFEERVADGAAIGQFWYATQASMRSAEGRPQATRLTVLANALAVVHFDDDQDILDLRRVTDELGRRQTATFQDELLAPTDTDPGRPVTTLLVRHLGERAWGKVARTPGTLTHESVELRSLCSEAALSLLMVGATGADGPVPRVETEEDLLEVFRSGDVPLWRRLVLATLAEPWAGRTDAHLSMLDPDLRPGEFAGVRALAQMARRIAEEDERRAVADHIRTTIASTGLTQREFATLVGTSPSRLSTYVTGNVTPSAAMLLRINRMAKRARAAAAKAGGTDRSDEPA
ncbi:MAG TPA: helix-turn-helix transcriptional regulator [Nocardioides sp.]|nr:helix-turn-helix transcriptional regulator [Nocardioides sp.]